jgi:CelD/BcsL family acetyltransferase involved in cellulose biosynthesis
MSLARPTETALYRTLSGDGMAPDIARAAIAFAADVTLAIHEDLAGIADDWCTFETEADCTAFQTFAWHAAWQTHIGDAAGARPAIVVGRRRGRIVFIVPLAVEPGRFVRRLVWHASDVCDYNVPLLDRTFSRVCGRDAFLALFAEMRRLIAARPGLAFEAIALTKMPETVGGQPNPFMALATTLNPSGAHATALAADWDAFYTGKRSSSTRQRDRSKRKRLAGLGEVRFVTAEKPGEVSDTLEVLMAQKSAAFAGMGVPDLFEKPGQRAFFHALASDPATRGFVHVSRLDVGATHAAVNLGLVFGGAYYHVLASYDAGEASRFGPGVVHLQELMAYAIRRGCHTFDFTIGDEGYKREWSDRTLVLHDYRSAATAKGWLVTLPAEALAGAKRVVKQTPFLWRAVSKGRAMVGALKSRGRRPHPIVPAE